jgi:two-component system cell cycle sensor histidine kinase/response regulator CckA
MKNKKIEELEKEVKELKRNIKEEKRTREEIEKKFRIISQQSLMAIGILQKGVFKHVSKAFEDLVEYPSQEILNWDTDQISNWVHPEDRVLVLKNSLNLPEEFQEGSQNLTYRIITKSERTKWVEQYSRVITFNGKPAIFFTTINITERKKAEEDLKENESKFRNLFERAHDAITYLDRRGIILDANKRAVELFGKDKESLVGKNFKILGIISLKDIPVMMKNLKKILSGKEDTIILSIKDKDGKIREVESTASFVGGDKKTKGIMVITRDITERKKTERMRRKLKERIFHSKKMESIGRLADGIAHDFNNILTGIIGYAELLKIRYMDPSTREGKIVDIIIKRSERAATLTRQLMDFAKGGSHIPMPQDINELIRETVNMSFRILEKKIKVNYVLKKNLDKIDADKHQIAQALTNIIINAKDAMPQSGTLTFKTENVYLDRSYSHVFHQFHPGDYVKLEISDTGIGMSRKIKTNIFEPFFTTKSEQNATGLGLAIVYSIIKNHNGHIQVYSEPNSGTTFNIYIPISRQKEIEEKKESQF